MSDIIEVRDVFNIDSFLVRMSIEKAFNSLNQTFFLLLVLKKFGFVNWIEIILNKLESCVSNNGKKQYFQLNRGAGDPVYAYLLILVMRSLIYSNKE